MIITLRNASSSRSRETSGRSGKNRSLTTSATTLAVTALRKLTIKAGSTAIFLCYINYVFHLELNCQIQFAIRGCLMPVVAGPGCAFPEAGEYSA